MERKRFSLELSEGLLNKIDQFKREWGLRSRGAIVERLLQELLTTEETDDLYSEDIYSEDIVGQENNSKKSKLEQIKDSDTGADETSNINAPEK